MIKLLNANNFVHVTRKNASGTPFNCRRNGRNKLWKTRPNDFRIPVKRGLYDYGYITQDNQNEWTAV